MDRDQQGGRDVGRDAQRDHGDEPPPLIRDAPPDYRAPIDERAPVSGHVRAPEHAGTSPTDAPEHDWSHAEVLLFPTFRPVGTHGLRIDEINPEVLA
jgi:hypothetical protein